MRLANGVRRIMAGLPRAVEAVWPGVRNDLYVAHESVYRFAVRFGKDRRVVDAACGTGYGSDLLAAAGARSVLGLDIDARRIAYARKNFSRPNLAFSVQDCQALSLPQGCADLVVSSNTLEHLADPSLFLRGAERVLAPDGTMIVAVPPVLSEADLLAHARNPFHVQPLSVRTWAELFLSHHWTFRFFAHRSTRPLDLSSPETSTATMADFAFIEGTIDDAYAVAPLSVIFVLGRPGGA